MKFAIFREIQAKSGHIKKKVYIEWDQEQIEDALIERFIEYAKTNPPEEAVYFAFKRIIEDCKKESIRIP